MIRKEFLANGKILKVLDIRANLYVGHYVHLYTIDHTTKHHVNNTHLSLTIGFIIYGIDNLEVFL